MLGTADIFRSGRWHKPASGFAITYGPLAYDATQTTVSVTWSTTEGSTGQVFYGATSAYGSQTTEETSFTYSTHIQSITSLTPGATYHFKVVSENANGDTVESEDGTFTMEGAASGTYPTPAPLAYSATVATSMPAYLGTTTDGNHGTEIARVGQTHLDRNMYSSAAAWNCDGTLFAISFGSGHERIYDTTTSPWTLLNSNASAFSSDTSWDDTNPLRFYRGSGSSIVRYTVNATTGAIATDTSWSVGSHDSVKLGGDQGQQAGDFVPYVFTDSGSEGYGVLNIATGMRWERGPYGSNAVDAVYISPDGSYCVVCFTAEGTGGSQGTWAMNASDGSSLRRVTTAQAHADMGQRTNGNQVLVLCSCASDGVGGGSTIGMYDLDDGDTFTALVTYWPGGHISCRNIARPGFVYVSNNLAYGTSDYAGRQDLFAVDFEDPPAAGGDVEYYAKQHAHDPRLSYNYDPMATVSPDGTLVAWSVGWDATSSVYCFVAGVDTGM